MEDLQQTKNQTIDEIFHQIKNLEEKAILLACREVIKETGQTPSLAAYFGVLYQTFKQIVTQEKKYFPQKSENIENGDTLERCRATVRLMSVVCYYMPTPMIKKIIDDTAKQLILFFSKRPPPFMARPGLDVAKILLTAPGIFFEDPISIKLYHVVLEQAVSGKPKVRKRAVTILNKILQISDGRTEKLSSFTEKYSVSIIQQCKQDNTLSTLHLLQLLNHVVGKFSIQTVKTLSEYILQLPFLGQSVVTICAMQFLGFVFEIPEIPKNFTVSLVNALFDLKPNTVDAEPMAEYMKTISKGFITLFRQDPSLTVKKLPKLISEALPTFQGDSAASNSKIAEALKAVLVACVTPDMLKECILGQEEGSVAPYLQVVQNLRPGLKYTFQYSWTFILGIFESIFTVTAKHQPKEGGANTFNFIMAGLFSDIIKDIAYLHEGRWTQPVESALGAALEVIGISHFLEILPIKYPSIDYPILEKPPTLDDHLWLLPFLKKYLHHSQLSYFISEFLPTSEILEANSKKIIEKTPVAAQQLSSIYLQIWELFPAFCNLPTDLPASFKRIARLLCTALLEKPNLRNVVSVGITNLINKNKALVSSNPLDHSPKENLGAISLFAKNFLPGLFNLLIEELPTADRNYVYHTAEAFISIADAPLVESTFSHVAAKLIKETTTPTEKENKITGKNIPEKNIPEKNDTENKVTEKKIEGKNIPENKKIKGKNIPEKNDTENDDMEKIDTEKNVTEKNSAFREKETLLSRLTDLVVIFIPYLEMKHVEILFRTIRPQIFSENIHLQKKSYKALVEICQYHRKLVPGNISELVKILEDTEPRRSNNATKKLRLRLMRIMFEETQELNIDTFKKLLPEIILTTREVNTGARDTALDVIKFLAQQCIKLGNNNLKTLYNIISAGLALQPHFVSSTLTTLSYLQKYFSENLDPEYNSELFRTSILFLESPHREVTHGALNYVLKGVKGVPLETILGTLPEIMRAIGTWEEGTRNKLHNDFKSFLEKLVKLVDYSVLVEVVPWKGVLINVRKGMKKKQKQKKEERKNSLSKEGENKNNKKNKKDKKHIKEDEEDSSDDEIDLQERKPKDTDGTWVLEGKTDDQIIDFLESSASKHVVSSDPSKVRPKRKIEEEFQKSEDGRFLVEDLPEVENIKKKRTEKFTKEEIEEFIGNSILPVVKKQKKDKKRKLAQNVMLHNRIRFKAKKAGGDVKRKQDKFEPYSYMPLDPKQLNKRRRIHAHKKYSNLLLTPSNKGRAIGKRKQRKTRK